METAAVIIAIAVAVLVAALVPALVELRKTIIEAKDVLGIVKTEIVPLLRDARQVAEDLEATTAAVRGGTQHAVQLLHVVGDVADTVREGQQALQHQAESMGLNVRVVSAGVVAGARVLKERLLKRRSGNNGR